MRQRGPRETADGSAIYRCLAVGLTDAQAQACEAAIVPVVVVRVGGVADACARMSMLLPLVVLVDEGMSAADRATLAEYASACGADVVAVAADSAPGDLRRPLLDAVRAAELRRFRAPA